MPMNANIRKATAADLAAIGALGAKLMWLHHQFDPRRFFEAPPDSERGYASYLSTLLDKANIVILVAEIEEKIVGYTYAGVEAIDYMSLRGPAGILYDIAVDASYLRHGIASLLLEATTAALRDRGAPQMLLSTAVQNESAQRLFERAGFRRTMIEMTKEL